MNVFTEGLSDCIMVDGIKYAVRTDYRVWIKFGEIIADNTIGTQKYLSAVLLCFDPRTVRVLPPNPAATLEAMCDFYACEKLANARNNRMKSKCTEGGRVFSFSADWEYIYASFLSEYGIDLLTGDLHWQRFMALLRCLPENSQFMKLIFYRTVNPEEAQDSSRRKYLRKMKRLCALPDNRSDEEKQSDLADKLSQLF